MAWEENSRICLHMLLIAILSRIGVTIVPSNGMRSEYEISKEQGNFLIPIGRTGYISKELWNELLEERQDDHTFDIYRHDIESLGDDTKTLDEVVEIVIELIKKVK